MKIHLNLPKEFDYSNPQKYTLQSIPKGFALYNEDLDMVLIPTDSKDAWIGFGMHDNGFESIDDDIPVEGVLFRPVTTIWVAT